MVPITYIAALLAILVSLSGCTQNAPPGSLQKNNNTSPSSTNLVQLSPSPSPAASVPPAPPTTDNTPTTAVTTTLSVDAALVQSILAVNLVKNTDGTTPSGIVMNTISPTEFQLVVEGAVAETLNAVLEVDKIQVGLPGGKNVTAKVGKDYLCIKADTTVCSISLLAKTGEVISKLDGSKVAAAPADLVIKTPYKDPGEYFILNPSAFLSTALHLKDPKDQSKGWEADPKHLVKQGSLVILLGYGKSIYDALTVEAKALVESDDAKERSEKLGKNIDCVKQLGKKSAQVEYNCKATFNYDTGAFNIIYTGELSQILQ